MKLNRNLVIAIGVGAVLLVAVAALAIGALKGDKAPEYLTAAAVMGDVEDAVLATGSLQPYEVVNVGSQTSGQVTSIAVTLGQTVNRGDLIATIESQQLNNQVRNQETQLTQARSQLVNQQANLQFAEASLARQEQLKSRNVGTQQQYDEAVNRVRSARAQVAQFESAINTREIEVEQAKNNLDKTNIRAPITAMVAEIVAREGSTINTNQQTPVIVKLAKMDIMTVRTQVSEADIVKIRPGQKVYFTILGEPNKRYYATLRTTELTPANGVLDPGANGAPKGAIYYNALFEVPNPDGILLPAMTAEVHVVRAEAKNVLTIPSAALGAKGADGRYTVKVVGADGKAVDRQVAIGLNNNFTAEVRGGLKAGDKVVIGQAGAPTATAAPQPLFGRPAAPQP